MVKRISNVTWTICIATNTHRLEHLDRLLKVLIPQVDKYKGKIEVLILFNNFENPLGYLRQAMVEEAKGEYISHIDDDDMVPGDFCDTIMPLLDGVDYIGFKVKFINEGIPMKPVYHSLRYNAWTEDEDGWYRGITHLNPLRAELVRSSIFPADGNVGEDSKWAMGVHAETEHFIDREMYVYQHVDEESVAYKPVPHDKPRRPVFKSKNVRFHPESTENA